MALTYAQLRANALEKERRRLFSAAAKKDTAKTASTATLPTVPKKTVAMLPTVTATNIANNTPIKTLPVVPKKSAQTAAVSTPTLDSTKKTNTTAFADMPTVANTSAFDIDPAQVQQNAKAQQAENTAFGKTNLGIIDRNAGAIISSVPAAAVKQIGFGLASGANTIKSNADYAKQNPKATDYFDVPAEQEQSTGTFDISPEKVQSDIQEGQKIAQYAAKQGNTEAANKILEITKSLTTESDKRSAQVETELQGRSKGVQIAANITGAVAQMIPAIIASAVTANPAVGLGILGLSAGGQSADTAYLNGATVDQAFANGLAHAGLEVGTEMMFGGIAALGKGVIGEAAANAVYRMFKGLASSKYAPVLKWAINTLGEGAEEMVSEIVSPYIDRLTYDKNADAATLKQVLQAGGMGAIVSVILGGFGLGGGQILENASANRSSVQATQDAPQAAQAHTPVATLPTVQSAANGNAAMLPTVERAQPAMLPTVTAAESTNAANESIGAADVGFDKMGALVDKYGAISAGEKPAADRVVEVPTQTADNNKVSLGIRTALEAAVTPKQGEATDAIVQKLVEGGFSHIPITNDATVRRAKASIESKDDFQVAVRDWFRDADSGKTGADLVATGAILYNNAINSGDAKLAVEILTSYVNMSKNTAQGLQAQRIMKTLSPEYRFYEVNKITSNLNENISKKSEVKNRKASEKSAKSTAEKVSKAAVRDSQNIPVGQWPMKTGDLLAENVTRTPKASKGKATVQLILNDLVKYANAHAEATTRKTSKTLPARITDYVSNKPFYDEAWQQAQSDVLKKYADNPEALAAYDEWLNQTVGEALASSVTPKQKINAKVIKTTTDKMVEMLKTGGFSEDALRDTMNTYIFGADSKITIDPALAEEYLKAADDATRDATIDKIYQNIADQVPSTLMDKWTALQYLNMLGNLKTQVRNVGGNAGFQPFRIIKDRIGALLEMGADTANKAAGGKGIERTKSFGLHKDLFLASAKDFASVKDAAMGESKYALQSKTTNAAIEDKRTIFKNNGTWGTLPDSNSIAKSTRAVTDLGWRAAEAYRKVTSNAMELGDVGFSLFTYADALSGYLNANHVTAEQMNSGKVNADLLDKARAYAINEAQRATYRDHNQFSDAVASVGFKNADTTAKRVVNASVQGLLPFRRTPANILVRGVEYSPLNIVNTIADTAKAVRGEAGASASTAIDKLSTTMTGTGLLLLGMYLFGKGLITGGKDDDKKQADFDKLTGNQPYALQTPDGKSTTLDWLAPESMPFFMGVELARNGLENGYTFKSVLDAGMSVTNPMLQMSMLQGINDQLESVSYSENPMIGLALNALVGYVTQGLTSTVGGQIERAAEENRMTTYTDKNGTLPTGMQYLLGKASAKTPGADFNQIPYINAWGEKESNGTLPQRIFNNFVNPSYTSTVEKDTMETELQRLYDATNGGSVNNDIKKILPARAEKSFDLDNKDYDLSSDQYEEFATKQGQTAYSEVSALISDAQYESLSDSEKAIAVNDAYAYALATAKMEVSDYRPSGWIATAMDMEPEARAEYMLYRAIWNSGGDTKSDQVKAVTATHDFSDEILLSGLTASQEKLYNQYAKGSVDAESYLLASAFKGAATVDYDKNGKAIQGKGATDKTLDYIDALDLTSAQKRALAKSVDIAEKTANHKWPVYKD